MSSRQVNISIITPLYNAQAFIAETIESVLAQTYQDWELILVDDLSQDSSTKIVEKYAALDKRIRLIRLHENSGAAVARNTALDVALGRYIAFIDSDDLWLSNKLEVQLDYMQQTGCPFTYTAYDKINEKGSVIGCMGVPEVATYQSLLKTCFIGCLTVMLDTEYFGKISMPLLRKRQDYGLWLKLLKQAHEARGLPEVLAQYRVHGASISANKLNTATYTWRLCRDVEKLSLLKSLYYFSHYATRGFLRHRLPKLARLVGILD